MSDELRVTVIVTGVGQQDTRGSIGGVAKSRLLDSAKRRDGTVDYQKLERPTVMRKRTPNVAEGNTSEEYLDIPAFLRRQEEIS